MDEELTDADLTNLRTMISMHKAEGDDWRNTRDSLYEKLGRMRDQAIANATN